jgi:hypothetical protein
MLNEVEYKSETHTTGQNARRCGHCSHIGSFLLFSLVSEADVTSFCLLSII